MIKIPIVVTGQVWGTVPKLMFLTCQPIAKNHATFVKEPPPQLPPPQQQQQLYLATTIIPIVDTGLDWDTAPILMFHG